MHYDLRLRPAQPPTPAVDSPSVQTRRPRAFDHVLTNYRLYRQFTGERDAHEVGAGASAAFEAQP